MDEIIRPSILEQDWRWTSTETFKHLYDRPHSGIVGGLHKGSFQEGPTVTLKDDGIYINQLHPTQNLECLSTSRPPLLKDCPMSQQWAKLQSNQITLQFHLTGSESLTFCNQLTAPHSFQISWIIENQGQAPSLFFDDQSNVALSHVSHTFEIKEGSALKLWQMNKSFPHRGLSEMLFILEKKAQLEHFSLLKVSGVEWRQSIHYDLKGSDSFVKSYLSSYAQQGVFDLQVTQSHEAPHSEAQTQVRSLGGPQSQSLFHGLIRVDRPASKTFSHQVHKTLLLSKSSQVVSTPRLEVLPHDVDCGHGSALDEVDLEGSLFLQMRGWKAQEAEELLKEAFLRENFPVLSGGYEKIFEEQLAYLIS